MKKYIRHTTCFLFFLLIFLAPGTVQASQKAGLTLMVYMCGSNLESGSGAASADLMEMASSGYDVRSMNVLVMTGGTDYWSIGLPTDSLCIYQPGRGSMRMLEAYEGESMGTPGPLAELLNFGYMNYPAEKYALILWDHGGGPLEGVCLDELYGAGADDRTCNITRIFTYKADWYCTTNIHVNIALGIFLSYKI